MNKQELLNELSHYMNVDEITTNPSNETLAEWLRIEQQKALPKAKEIGKYENVHEWSRNLTGGICSIK